MFIIYFVKIINRIRGIRHYLYQYRIKRKFKFVGNNVLFLRFSQLEGAKHIVIKDNVFIGENCYVTAWDKWGEQIFSPQILLEESVNIGAYNHITAINRIQIGKQVIIGKFVTITDNSHGMCKEYSELDIAPVTRPLYSKGPVVIEDNVWIGDKVVILPNVTIGKGAIIGAGSIVTKNIPPYTIAAGNPAKIIKTLKK